MKFEPTWEKAIKAHIANVGVTRAAKDVGLAVATLRRIERGEGISDWTQGQLYRWHRTQQEVTP